MGTRLLRRLGRVLSLAVAACVVGGVASLVYAQAPNADGASTRANFQYRQAADSVVLRYSESLPASADTVSGRSVVVYGDGRVVIHFPAIMKRAGDYTLQLTPGELRALLGRVVARNFVDLDEAEARRALNGRRAASPGEPVELFAVHDDSISTIELNLDSYQPADSRAAPRRNVKRNVRFYALRTHAKRNRDNAPLQDLAAVQEEMIALLEREDLEPMP